MNKKFSTLMASLLMASSFSVVAEGSTPENGHYEFRRGKVLSNVTFGEVKAIDAQKWYQLRAKDPKTGREGYLVHSRNQETGEVFLRLVEDVEGAQKTPLLASLWQIDYGNTDGLSGGKYRFINKETKVSLMYDYAFAIDAEGKSIDKPRASQMIDGCVTRWAWYQGNSQDINFEFTAPYAYFNNKKDSVMIMKANEKGFITSYKDIDEHIHRGRHRKRAPLRYATSDAGALQSACIPVGHLLHEYHRMLLHRPVLCCGKPPQLVRRNTVIPHHRTMRGLYHILHIQ